MPLEVQAGTCHRQLCHLELPVKSGSPEYLLAMKLFAARELDIDDTVLLMSKTSLLTATELLDLVQNAYQPRPVATKVQYFIAEAVHRYELAHPTPSTDTR